MNRDEMLGRALARREPWDVAVVGGGATGAGVAIDAAARGYAVLLFERHDFGKGTSSRSTKLVHGGVRYLAQGDIRLVREALRERGLMRQNAPHVVHELAFVVPSYSRWTTAYYGLGLWAYNLLSGRLKFGSTRRLSRAETLARVSTLNTNNLRGGVIYYDGQFDDARLLVNMTTTAAEQGATVLNYARVTGLTRDAGGRVNGVAFRDEETGGEGHAAARVVVNATGVFCDDVRHLSDPGAPGMVSPSQGIHLVFDRSFLPGDTAFVVPRTPDGRVMFAIPWHGHALVGTTDVAVRAAPLEPVPTEQEVAFVLDTAGRYLQKPPTRADVLSAFAGIRPLVSAGAGKNTAALSRDHTIRVDPSGLLTITGGKWTTYRNMAEDCVNRAAELGKLEPRPCVTRTLRIHGAHDDAGRFGPLAVYGSDAPLVAGLADTDAELARPLHADLPYIGAEVVWAARNEMARSVEDVLARRTRALFLNARAALAMAPRVAELLAVELGRDAAWRAAQVKAFGELAVGYVLA
ncbi:MAG: glycerol-3-phosphate dehydrogenase/oxidase [Planctomycetes bacterium]|nr:glycerol-3-phosphate dehydrogenase/oxidase [Planctomycetota bacterium]